MKVEKNHVENAVPVSTERRAFESNGIKDPAIEKYRKRMESQWQET